MAIVGLEGVRIRGPHGFYPEEEVVGNEFLIDVFVSTNTKRAALTDDLGNTVNYETLYLMVQSEMRKSSQLIETLADRIVMRIEEYYENNIDGVRIVLRKLDPPLGGEVRAAYLEMGTGTFRANPQKLTFR